MSRSTTRPPTGQPAPLCLSDELLPALLESALERGAEVRFEVDGHSMMPLIRPGDVVRVGRPASTGPKLGDVVAIRRESDGSLLVHRVVRLRGGVMVPRGDNNTEPDGEFAASNVLAVVVKVERKGRNVWFGAGRLGAVVGMAVGAGFVRRFNRATFPVYRRVRAWRAGPAAPKPGQ